MNLLNTLENFIRILVIKLSNYLPVKVIRDDRGVPFLYRYHLFALTNDGPGLCIHHFVKSDPDLGYHDHPWSRAISFILAGKYEERIYCPNLGEYNTFTRNRWTFNYLNGNSFHRVMLPNDNDVWTIFAFQKRSKPWGMISLDGVYHPLSEQIIDGGWWNFVKKGLFLHNREPLIGNVISTVDIIVMNQNKVLLIKRSKEPFKNEWAFPGGRIESSDLDLYAAACRELGEETNIHNVSLKYHCTIGNNTRDPRGFSITNVFYTYLEHLDDIKAGDDAIDFKWVSLSNLPKMAFDHKEILQGFI